MNCPCCGEEMAEYDTIRAGSAHPKHARGTYLWTVYRCSTCAESPSAECTCESEGIYNDSGDEPSAGYGCSL